MIEAVGVWGQRWVETEATLENLDPELLMWDMRRNIDPKPMPRRRKLFVSGNRELETSMRSWFGLSRFAKVDKLVALAAVQSGHSAGGSGQL